MKLAERTHHFWAASTKAAIVLIPSYAVAYLTDKMVYVIPTLAAASFFAASLDLKASDTRNRVDDAFEQAPSDSIEAPDQD